ncbi:hypothetical protein NDU88_002283 [Pleurodeles waltl]|uniref:Uncharacterized protein n=1 Tax=Pleurodeles waltl TaxID=8319 RepID=A0AAV7NF01_PLEWA|nr:hypothetical protein NDU88_002283 [Pleurodeles waltl]
MTFCTTFWKGGTDPECTTEVSLSSHVAMIFLKIKFLSMINKVLNISRLKENYYRFGGNNRKSTPKRTIFCSEDPPSRRRGRWWR